MADQRIWFVYIVRYIDAGRTKHYTGITDRPGEQMQGNLRGEGPRCLREASSIEGACVVHKCPGFDAARRMQITVSDLPAETKVKLFNGSISVDEITRASTSHSPDPARTYSSTRSDGDEQSIHETVKFDGTIINTRRG